jgi:hypothetical protein
MAFYSYPFESQNTGTPEQPVYDRAITAENERQFNKLRYTNGVFIESSLDDDLQVIPGNGMSVKVSKGGCHIEGALAYNDNAVTLSLEAANATLRRIDRVVARFNTSTNVRSIMVYVKTGTNSTNPVAPSLQRESNFWEIGLADITIPAGATSISASNILDTRMDDSLCGRVLPAIPYITQLGSLYEQYQELVSSALSGTVAGQLEARISAEENKVQPINKGGTGKTTRAAAMNNLQYIPSSDLSFLTGNGGGDTTANWVKAGTGLAYISTEGLLENQPMKYGWLYNFTSGSVIVAQQFIGLDGNSPVWYRSGNAGGWYPGSKGWVRSLDEKNGVQIKKVWQNASPSSLFPPQDVAIAANEGNLIGIEFESQTVAKDRRITWIPIKSGFTTELVTIQSTSDGGNIFVTRRAVTITNAGSINFDKGYYRYVGESNNRHDGYSIPTAVYIAKGVS